VVRNGSGITNVAQLKGKRLGVPFVSTSHFHALLALKQAGAHRQRREGAQHAARRDSGCMGARRYRRGLHLEPGALEGGAKRQGRDDIRQDRSANGLATFDGFVVNREWATGQPGVMTTFVKILAKGDAAYRANPANGPARRRKAKAVAAISGGTPDEVAPSLALYQFPSPQETGVG